MAIPAIVMVSVSWIIEMPTPNSSGINGRLGRYISVDSGAIAARVPKKTVSHNRLFFSLTCIKYSSYIDRCAQGMIALAKH